MHETFKGDKRSTQTQRSDTFIQLVHTVLLDLFLKLRESSALQSTKQASGNQRRVVHVYKNARQELVRMVVKLIYIDDIPQVALWG